MKKLILITIVALSFSSSALAGTAFKTGEKTTGATKQCYYKYLGNEYTRTVKSHELCPLSINV